MKSKTALTLPVLLGLLAPALSACAYNPNPTNVADCNELLKCSDGEVPIPNVEDWYKETDN